MSSKHDSALGDSQGGRRESHAARDVASLLRDDPENPHMDSSEVSAVPTGSGAASGQPQISEDLLRRVRARREADAGMQVNWQMKLKQILHSDNPTTRGPNAERWIEFCLIIALFTVLFFISSFIFA